MLKFVRWDHTIRTTIPQAAMICQPSSNLQPNRIWIHLKTHPSSLHLTSGDKLSKKISRDNLWIPQQATITGTWPKIYKVKCIMPACFHPVIQVQARNFKPQICSNKEAMSLWKMWLLPDSMHKTTITKNLLINLWKEAKLEMRARIYPEIYLRPTIW